MMSIDMSIELGLQDISIEEYHSAKAVGRSGIMTLNDESAFHFWSKYLNPERPSLWGEEKTEATIIGHAFHTLILEPEKLEQRYAFKNYSLEKLGKVPLLRDVGREAYDEAKKYYESAKKRNDEIEANFLFSAEGKQILSEKSYNTLLSMRLSVESRKEACQLISGAEYEKSFFWKDPDTGLICKARPDIWHKNSMIVGDLKTIVSAKPSEFQFSMKKYGYHVQSAIISEGMKNLYGISARQFYFIVVEKDYPWVTEVYELDELALEEGIHIFKENLFKLKECYEKNEWPSYGWQMVTLPRLSMQRG